MCVDAFKKEVLEGLKNYDRQKDFVVADCPEKTEVVEIIEELLAQIEGSASNVSRTPRGALLCFPWDKIDFPHSEDDKWAVSFRGPDESFLLTLSNNGGLRGHLYSDNAEIHRTIKEFKGAKMLTDTELDTAMAEGALPLIIKKTT
jgi:hypothetical protein